MFLPSSIDETVTKENKTEPYSKTLHKKKKKDFLSYNLSGRWAEPRRFGVVWLTPILKKNRKQKTKSHFGENQNKQ